MGKSKKEVLALTKHALAMNPVIAAGIKNKTVVMNVENHDITIREFKIFELYCKTGSYPETASTAGISINTMYTIKKQDWWNALIVAFLENAQTKLHVGLSENATILKNAIIEIWQDSFNPKLAMAVVRSFEIFSKLGKAHGKSNVTPLLQTKQELFVDNSVTNNTVNFNMEPYFNLMTPEEVDQYSIDGLPIQRLIDKAKEIENIVEIKDD